MPHLYQNDVFLPECFVCKQNLNESQHHNNPTDVREHHLCPDCGDYVITYRAKLIVGSDTNELKKLIALHNTLNTNKTRLNIIEDREAKGTLRQPAIKAVAIKR